MSQRPTPRSMRRYLRLLFFTCLALASPASSRESWAAEAGLVYPFASEASDQRRGNVLFYNLFTSKAANPAAEDTRLTLTNHSETSANFVHLFFVEGSSGLVARRFVCLTSTQTTSFRASDVLPDFRGYVIAVSVDGVLGCPVGDLNQVNSNRLSGQAHVKVGNFEGVLPAVAATALFNGSLPGCDPNSVTTNLLFNGVNGSGYTRLPRSISIDELRSRADGHLAYLVLNHVGGDLEGGLSGIGSASGALYDDGGNALPFSFSTGRTQRMAKVTNKFPVTTPTFNSAIPSGATGWARFANDADAPLLGSALFLPGGAVNLRTRTLSANGVLVLPVEPPSC